MTRDDLMDEAKRLKLTGLSQKDKPTLRDAIKIAREAEAAAEKQRVADGVPKKEPEQVEGQPLTPEQVETLRDNSTEAIRKALDGPKKLSRHWVIAFEAELATRQTKLDAEALKKKMTSPMNGYLITKGGGFVVRGRKTKIHTGTVVYETTHNLDALKAQGIEYEPFTGTIEVGRGPLGRITTKVIP